MTEIIATSGQNIGKLSVARSIQTMSIGEIWTLAPGTVSIERVRVDCSRVHAVSDMRFSVLGPCFDNANIRIIRIK